MGRHYLEHLFNPASIAVFGAEGEAASGLLRQRLAEAGYAGPVHAIAPARQADPSQPGFASLDALDKPVDLALIATPADTVPGLIRSLGEHRIKAAIVLSEGFDEREGAGKALRRALLDEGRKQEVRILGPNSLGLMRPAIGLNATPCGPFARRGSLALVSQSGAICTAILDWADTQAVGFSSVVSVGDAADIGLGDILDYLSTDPETRSILLYIEGVRDARRFMSGLRAAARMKPTVIVKAGRRPEAARAALAHTGSLAGVDDVFNAALERAGVVRAGTIEQLFAAAQILATPYRAGGKRLAIVTNAGGPGVMATDWAAGLGIQLAEPGEATIRRVDEALAGRWSRGNPLDLHADASPAHYQAAVEACLSDDGIDGLLVMLAPQASTQPTETAQALAQAANPRRKPLLACWLGAASVLKARETFAQHHIPSFTSPESAVDAFGFLAAYRRNQALLMQVPGPLADPVPPDSEGARLIIEAALEEKRSLLSFLETRALLRAFHIPLPQAMVARSPNEALAAAECLGFPVAMKILSPDILHKSDVGGVRLNITSAQSVRHEFNDLAAQVRALRPEAQIEGVSVEKMSGKPHGRELLAGILDDPVFGPVVCVGAGGMAAEALADRALALPPLNEHIARAMIGQTKVAKMLGQFRGLPPAKLESLIQVLLRISEMACELPQIKEMDINALAVDEDGCLALDARIVVRHLPPGRSRYGHMAIQPYPSHLVNQFQLANGSDITIRPIRPEDADIEQDFVRRLSPEAKYFRFMETLHELSPQMLVRFTQLDYSRDLAFIATVKHEGRETEIGVARYFTNPDGKSGEFALVVDDQWQGLGLGTRLMGCLIDAAQEKNLQSLQGEVLANNVKMLHLMDKLGFTKQKKAEDPSVVMVVKTL